MPLPTPVKKPLVLVFPATSFLHYERCLVLAKYLRPLFEIRFFHDDRFAPLVYQHGFDSFLSYSFPQNGFATTIKKAVNFEEKLEMQFLEQVEILETLQPTLVIGYGIYTLGMATEYTGFPIISLIDGYLSPFYIHQTGSLRELRTHEPFRLLRKKYGLQEKQNCREELTGDLNWICDLPDLFLQRELPLHYEVIGPLVEKMKITRSAPSSTFTFKLNSFKKAILFDVEGPESTLGLELLNDLSRNYNLVADSLRKDIDKENHPKGFYYFKTAEILPQVDLLICNTERLLYTAISQGIPILFIKQFGHHENIITALKKWSFGTDWQPKGCKTMDLDLQMWANIKHSISHYAMQYKIQTASAMLENRLLKSLALHFPHLIRTMDFVF